MEQIRIVLVSPSHPGNIGSAARAMKTMGLTKLCLVAPRDFPHANAEALASGASDVLRNAKLFNSLDDALTGTVFSIAATARRRELSHTVLTPAEVAETIKAKISKGDDIAIVFGPERTGLTIEDAMRCNVLSMIPSNPEYASLNLAQAVQVFAYEIWSRREVEGSVNEGSEQILMARHEEVERLIEHFERVSVDIGFLNINNPGRLMQRIRRLLKRTELEREELNILRGFLSAIEKKGL